MKHTAYNTRYSIRTLCECLAETVNEMKSNKTKTHTMSLIIYPDLPRLQQNGDSATRKQRIKMTTTKKNLTQKYECVSNENPVLFECISFMMSINNVSCSRTWKNHCGNFVPETR